MAGNNADVSFSGTLKVVRNMEIAQDGKVLVMLGTLIVKDGLIIGNGIERREQINLEVISAKNEVT